jgi:hypothetical protein
MQRNLTVGLQNKDKETGFEEKSWRKENERNAKKDED